MRTELMVHGFSITLMVGAAGGRSIVAALVPEGPLLLECGETTEKKEKVMSLLK